MTIVSESIWALVLLLFLDGATTAAFTTPLLLHYGHHHEPWMVAVFGGAASALGSSIQVLAVRWILNHPHPLFARLAPSREKLASAFSSYPSASFLMVALARATPIPDAPLKLVAAAGNYPAGRYALAVFLGALPYYFVLALVGHLVKIPLWVLVLLVAAIAGGIVVDLLRRRSRAGP